MLQGPPKGPRMLGAKQPVAFCAAWCPRGPHVKSGLADAWCGQLPPSSSSCYQSNARQRQSWTKTPLNYLKRSNSSAPALAGLLSLQMDVLYLATSNVSIRGRDFSRGAASTPALGSEDAKSQRRGTGREKHTPTSPEPLRGGRRVP